MDKKINRVIVTLFIVMQMFVFTVHISADEGKQAVIPSRIIINDYFIDGGGLVAGEISAAVLVLRNTSKTSTVSSLLLTGWIDSEAPAEFYGTNQIYVPAIPPSGDTSVELEIYTNNVDLSSINSISAGFIIDYKDEESEIERSTNISIRLPILRKTQSAIDEADMNWMEPETSTLYELMNADYMQKIYITGFIVCCLGSIVMIMVKLKVLRFKRFRSERRGG